MADDKLAERVGNALGRAQTFAFTTLTTAVIVGYVALTNLAELRAEYGQLQQERADLTDIANRSDNALREIRRYFLLRLPGQSDAPAVRNVLAATALAQRRAENISSRLVQVGSFEQVLAINKFLLPLRTRGSVVASVNVDFSPQSLSVFERLELFRLRDIAVLSYLIASDPVGISEALEPFAGVFVASAEGIERLHKALETNNMVVERQMLDQTAIIGEDLRKAVEQYGVRRGVQAIGSLASSYTETIGRVRALEERQRTIETSLRGDFDVKVPFLEQTMPVRLVVGLFPVGLVVGYGMVAVSLAFAHAQLTTMAADQKKVAANVGSIFDQLRQPRDKGFARVLSWVILVIVLVVPWLIALIVVAQYAVTLSGITAALIGALLFVTLFPISSVFSRAWSVSGIAKAS